MRVKNLKGGPSYYANIVYDGKQRSLYAGPDLHKATTYYDRAVLVLQAAGYYKRKPKLNEPLESYASDTLLQRVLAMDPGDALEALRLAANALRDKPRNLKVMREAPELAKQAAEAAAAAGGGAGDGGGGQQQQQGKQQVGRNGAAVLAGGEGEGEKRPGSPPPLKAATAIHVAVGSVRRRRQQQLQRGGDSGLRGVTWHEASGRWEAKLEVQGEELVLGYYEDKEEAGRMADRALLWFQQAEVAALNANGAASAKKNGAAAPAQQPALPLNFPRESYHGDEVLQEGVAGGLVDFLCHVVRQHAQSALSERPY